MTALTDKFLKVASESSLTTMAAPGKAIGATSINVVSATGFPTTTAAVVAIRVVDSSGNLVPGTYTEWLATVSGTTITFGASPSPVYGTDQVYASGTTTQVYVPLSSYAHNRLMDALLTSINQDGSLIQAAVLTALGASSLLPTGALQPFAGSSVPSGFLLADGSAVSRATYAALFTAIGTAWGAGDGSTTFNLPDGRAKTFAGYKSGDANFGTLGASPGAATHAISGSELPTHNHGINDPGHGHGVNDPGHSHSVNGGNIIHAGGGGADWTANTNLGATYRQNSVNWADGTRTDGNGVGVSIAGNGTGISTANAGSSTAMSLIQPTLTGNWIIKT